MVLGPWNLTIRRIGLADSIWVGLTTKTLPRYAQLWFFLFILHAQASLAFGLKRKNPTPSV